MTSDRNSRKAKLQLALSPRLAGELDYLSRIRDEYLYEVVEALLWFAVNATDDEGRIPGEVGYKEPTRRNRR
jgi:hypothetical protein